MENKSWPGNFILANNTCYANIICESSGSDMLKPGGPTESIQTPASCCCCKNYE